MGARCFRHLARSRFDPHLYASLIADAPGHARRVVREAVAAIGAEQDDAAVAAEPAEEIGDGGFCRGVGSIAGEDAVDCPLAEHELHDGLAPAGERDGGAEVVGVAAAADERGVADAAGRLVERAAGGGGGGEIAAGVERDGADGVVRRRVVFGRRGVGGEAGSFLVCFLNSREGPVGKAGALFVLRYGKPLAFAVERPARRCR